MPEPRKRVTLEDLQGAPQRPARKRPTLAELEAAPEASATRRRVTLDEVLGPEQTSAASVEPVGSLIDARPSSFVGRNLDAGLATGLASLDRFAANAADLVIPDAIGGDRLADYLRTRAGAIETEAQRRSQPGDEELGGAVLRGVGSAPAALAKAAPGVSRFGPVAGLAATGALERADEGIGGAAAGAARGAAEGSLFPLTRALGLPLAARVGVQAAGGAGIERVTGGSTQDAVVSAILGGLLEPLGGPPRGRGSRSAVDAARAAAEPARPVEPGAEPVRSELEAPATESAPAESVPGQPVAAPTPAPAATEAPAPSAAEVNAQRAAVLFDRAGKVAKGYEASRTPDGGVTVRRAGREYTFAPEQLRATAADAVDRTPPQTPATAPAPAPEPVLPQRVELRTDEPGVTQPLDVTPELGAPLVTVEPPVDAGTAARAQEFASRDFDAPDLDIPQGRVAVNLGRIDGPEALQQAVAEVSRLYQPQIAEARRGEVTFAEQRRLADELGLDVETALARRRGQSANAEELRALRRLNLSIVEQARTVAVRIRKGLATDQDKAEFVRLFGLAEAVQARFLGARAEVARALGSLRDSEKATAGYDVFARFPGLRELTSKDPAQRAKAEADPVGVLAEVLDELPNPAATSRFLRTARDPKLRDVAQELYVNSLLSGVKTQVVNLAGNALTVLQTVAESYGAAARGAFRGGTDKVTFGEANARAFGVVQGARDGLRLARDVFLRREVDPGKYDIRQGALETYAARLRESPSTTASGFGRALGVAEPLLTFPTRLLGTGDALFRQIGARQELNALAYRAGREAGYSGRDLARFIGDYLEAPPPEALRQARRAAERLTFQTPLGPVASNFAKGIQSIPGGFLIAPFVRTPVNIVKFSAERSPFGLLMRGVRDDLRGKNGKSARDTAQAKLFIGTALPVSLVAYAAEGTITGGGPTDPEARRVWFDAGFRPYSVRIGDSFYSYARLEPISTLLGTVADFSEIAGYVDAEGTDKLAGQIIGAVSRNIANKTYLTTAIDLAETISDPDRYAAKFFQRQAGSLTVPTLVSDVTRFNDPTLRDVRSAMDQIRSRIPGYSSTLPARVGAWGEPVLLDPGVGPDIVSPLYFSRSQADPTKQEAARLRANLSPPKRNVSGVELSGAEYEQLSRLAGQTAKRVVDALVSSPGYARLPNDTLRRTLIERLYREGRDAAVKAYAQQLAARDPARFAQAARTKLRGQYGPLPGL